MYGGACVLVGLSWCDDFGIIGRFVGWLSGWPVDDGDGLAHWLIDWLIDWLPDSVLSC